MTQSNCLLEGRELSLQIEKQTLLSSVSFMVQPGQRIVLTGPSGSGKSLLVRAMALLEATSKGDLHWCGEAVKGPQVPIYRRQVMYLHQRPTFFAGSVEDNLQLAFSFGSHRARKYDPNIVHQLLDKVGRTGEFLTKDSDRLSGGEAQIAAILRALILEPTILLLDEPTAAIDHQTTLLFEQLVLDWVQQCPHERAFVWITHSDSQADKLATVRWSMENGRLFLS